VFAELAHERFCRPRPTAVSGPLDALRQAFVDRTLEVRRLHAVTKAAAGAAFAKVTPDKPTCHDAKARRAAANKRKTTAAAAAAVRPPTPLAKPTDQAQPPPKKRWCGPPRRFLLPDIFLHATSRTSKMAGVGAHRRERPSPRLDPRHGVRVKFKHGVRPKPFNHGISMLDATPAQLEFLNSELPRFEACGAWKRSDNPRYVSRMLLVPKPECNQFRLLIDLRELNRYCSTFNMTCETLKHLRHLSRPGDYFVSLDLTDGYYTLGIREEDRDYITVNYRGTLWRLVCLPMGWSGSTFYFCKLTQVFTNHLRRPLPPTLASTPENARLSKRFLRNARWRGTRLLPYMDNFLFLADSYHDALLLRQRVEKIEIEIEIVYNMYRMHRFFTQKPYASVAVSGPSQLCHTGNLQVRARP
jgi:hypothetical protein